MFWLGVKTNRQTATEKRVAEALDDHRGRLAG